MLDKIKQNAKHLIGWKTSRKIVVFSVDDYGVVRMASREALEALKAIDAPMVRYDHTESMETRQDLESLFEVLESVRDKSDNPAVFTPFSVPCNMDFERMVREDFRSYQYELLPVTFDKLAARDPAAYKGAWDLWKEGISRKLMVPQFHGREHFNLKVLEEKLADRDEILLTALKHSSNIGLKNHRNPALSYLSAFAFWEMQENERFEALIEDGLNAFQEVFGYRSVHFTAPAGGEHSSIYTHLRKGGIKFVDMPLVKREHQGQGSYKTKLYYTGKKLPSGVVAGVRNVVFEPTSAMQSDWVSYTLGQIDKAFSWNRPAIVSSHRANFSGYMDPDNRETGLSALKELLAKITSRWPDVEFLSSAQLYELIVPKDEN